MPILGIIDSQKSGHLYNNSYTSLQTVTVGAGGASSITFSSIPSTYTHLQVRLFGRTTSSNAYATVYIQNNSDTGTNYTYHALSGSGSSASSSGRGTGSDTAMTVQNLTGAGATANNFGATIIDILDYANTNKYKTMRELGGYDNNGSGYINLNSSVWLNTNAISSLTITADGNFVQYTSAALYGVN